MGGTGVSAWGDRDVVAAVVGSTGFSDPGEEAALAAVAEQRRGRVLDIGVGCGRTTALLLDEAASYVGIDITEPMLDQARRRFPGVDLRRGNARDLATLPDHHFDLVVFSFNGLDALDRADRVKALRSMRRVLAPGGRVVFSSLNIDGVSFDERPWRIGGLLSRRGFREVAMAGRHPIGWLHGVGNFRRTSGQREDGTGWARRALRAHEFRFVVHFATLADTVALAGRAGLQVVEAFSERGVRLDLSEPHPTADYVHFVCRRGGPNQGDQG